MKFTDSNLPASEEDLRVLEQKLGFSVPSSYRRFLKQNNGGVPECNYMETDFGEISVAYFMGTTVRKGDLFSELKAVNSIFSDRIAEEFFIIGEDFGGNMFLIHKDTPNFIYWWDHEEEKHYKIADDFDQFLLKLKPDPYD